MSESANERWWHVWAGSLGGTEDEEPSRVHVTLGPTVMSPEDEGMDGKGIKIKDRTLPFGLVDPEKPGPEMTYLASFQHEPDDDEIDALREERGL